MRKLSILIVFLIVFIPSTVFSATESNEEPNLNSVIKAMQYVLGLGELNRGENLDINHDGVIDIRDVTLLMRRVLLLDKPVPISTQNAEIVLSRSTTYIFQQRVTITNISQSKSRDIYVEIPTLENKSFYQTTKLITDYDLATEVFDLEYNESREIVLEYEVIVNTVRVEGNFNQAYEIYKKYQGSGNCRDLALKFISECSVNGIQAREVVGFTRPARGDTTFGDLKECRHSWAEFYVEGLGWIPVDLTFGYFGELPYTSHIVEGYGDRSIKVNYQGGELKAVWDNYVY